MPTGCTAAIEKGITFNQYAMGCARAFGSCVTMRDVPKDTPIPEEFKASDWNEKELAKAEIVLARLYKLTIAEANQSAITEYEAEVKRQTTAIEKDRTLMAKYRAMLDNVNQWQPPTPDHVEFKNFMVEQIESSIKHDGMESYYNEHPPKLLTGESWLTNAKEKAIWNIEYHTKGHNDEVDRTNSRNRWVKDLRDSLQ